jgi:hypothetical protein
LAASVGCEYLIAVPVAALVVCLLVFVPPRQWWSRLLPLALGALGPALILGAYHSLCFGAPWTTGYSFIVDPQFAAGHARGVLGIQLPQLDALWGLSFGRRRGLFYIAPVALLLASGLFAQARARNRLALQACTAIGALLLVNASYYMWWGGAAAGPRHLVPVLGLLVLGLPWIWERPRLRRLLFVLAGLSAFNMMAIAAVGLEAPEQGDLLADFVYDRLLGGRLASMPGASNLGLELGLVRGGSLGPLMVWMLVGAHVLARQLGEVSPAPSPIVVRPEATPAA